MADKDKRVLLIDDDEDLRELFQLSVGKEFTVAVAEDGEKGLAKVPVFRPHVIVLDLMMPRLDGFAVIHKLQEEGYQMIPVIVISGYSEEANESIVSAERNVVSFLHKPLKIEELIAKISALLSA